MGVRVRVNLTTALFALAQGLRTFRVAPNIYQGSAPPPGRHVADAGFDVLVLCASGFQPHARDYPGVRVLRCDLEDEAINETTWRRSQKTSHDVVRALQKGHNVLVTCEMGKNRSGLIVGQVLCMHLGMRGHQAVQAIKRARPGALKNESYARALVATWP